MADEFNTSTNWWDSSRNRYDSGSSSSPSGLNNNFSWPSDMVDAKLGRSSMDSASVSDTSSIVFHDNTHKLQQQQQQHPPQDSSSTDLHMMGLGLSSQSMDWTHAGLLRGESKSDQNSFRPMFQENLNFRSFSDQPPHFSPHHPGGSSSDSSVTCQGGLQSSNYQMDSSVLYGNPSSMLQGLLGSDNNQYGAANYGNISNNNELVSSPSWSNKLLPNFLRNSPPKQTAHSNNNNTQLHFSNNAPFWNASATSINDVRPTFFSPMQPQFPASNFEEKPSKQNISEIVRDSSSTIVKKSGSETTTKRPRNETSSPVPAFKVRKEKMGDRITALQQLVSPFGKTDTASVLSEAIEYIRFLHQQVSVLSTPYLKNTGAPIHNQQNSDKSSNDPEGQKQDLRSRGLCLVPISSTFPVTHETTVDFWTPTFGGTYR